MSENIVSANEKYARELGADFGRVSDTVQGEFLTGFAHSLKISCGGREDTQISFMVDKLSAQALDVVIEMGKAAEYRRENPA